MWTTLLCYSLGFLGCLLIRQRYQLGALPFTFLFLLFNFNGYITAHLSCGHTMWNGYFLLPFFCLWSLALLDDGPKARPALLVALTLFGMMLIGAFHHVMWCWLFLGLLLAFNPRHWRPIVVVLLFSAALSAHRLGPTAVAFWDHSQRGFYAGYPTMMQMVDGLIRLEEHDRNDAGKPWLPTHIPKDHPLGWNEYDMYIGLLALVALLYFGVARRLRAGPQEFRYRDLDAPLLALTFLSFNYFYAFIANLPIPLFNAEGVTSRFFIIPLVFMMILSAVHMQRFLEEVRPSAALWVLLIGGLLQTAFVLAEHSWMWQIIPAAPGESPLHPTDEKKLLAIVSRPDDFYVRVVQLSAGFSLVALAVWFFFYLRPDYLPLRQTGADQADAVSSPMKMNA
jgi:hypothetical protein